MQPELRHLRAFLAVAEEGSTNRAGATLFRAQSGVSRAIHRLEAGLGVELFERHARGMLLTEYGHALLVRARRIHAELQRAGAELASIGGASRIRGASIFKSAVHERHVSAFIRLTEQHHMAPVADSLGITQPAVSMAIRQLEDGIGVRLFERGVRGMIPTDSGVVLALSLKRALAEARHAQADVAGLRGITQGTVRVGALPLSRTRLLPECVAAVVDAHPGLRVATVEGSFESLAAELRAGDLDFIVGALRPPGYASDLTGEPLVDEELAIVSRCGHAWASRKRIPDPDLARARWVLPRARTPTRMLFERALHARGLGVPNVVVETSDLAVLRGVLLSSDLVTAISPHQLAYELAEGLLQVLPIELPDTRRGIGITRRTDGLAWPGAKLLMDEIARRSREVLSAPTRRAAR